MPSHAHADQATTDRTRHPEPAVTPSQSDMLPTGPLPASAILSLQRMVGSQGVQRLLDSRVQRKKVINEDVRIEGSLPVKDHVFSYSDIFGKTGLLTDGNVITKTLRTDGNVDVGGDLVGRGATRKPGPVHPALICPFGRTLAQ